MFCALQFCIELVIFLAATVTVTWQQAASYSEIEVVVNESKNEGNGDSETPCALNPRNALHVVMLHSSAPGKKKKGFCSSSTKVKRNIPKFTRRALKASL